MVGRLFTLFAILCSLTFNLPAEKSVIASVENLAAPRIKAGERLTYSVKWNDVKAAKVTMSAESAKDEKFGDSYRVEVDVKTIGVARDLIAVNDRFTAFLD